MEFSLKQEKLTKALNMVSRVAAGARTTLPILNNVLIKVEKKKVCLVSTNLDMAVVDYLPTVDNKDGEITVPARLLAEFVSNLPSGEVVKVKTDGMKIKVTAGKYSSVINGVSSEEFPELPQIDEKSAVIYKMGVEKFKEGLSEVIIASSNDTTRPALTGVYFNTDGGALYIAATDGYRLAEKKFIDKVKSEVMVIVPSNSLQEVLRSIPDDIDEIEMLFDETQVRFRMGEIEVTSKLIDGSFPDYRQLIPKKTDVEVLVDRDELVRVTKIAALFAKESSRAIKCETKKDLLLVSSISNEMGENESEIAVKVDKEAEVKLDSRFLMDALNALKDKNVKFGFSQTVSPIVLKNEKGTDYTHIVMPLNN